MNENLKNKIQKLLVMSERGGTENEMQVAMKMVQDLLTAHNLSMSDVQQTEIKDEDIVQESNDVGLRSPWQTYIWFAISKLYFCELYKKSYELNGKNYMSVVITGKQSNVEIVRLMSAYIINLCNELADKPGTDRSWKNAFKNGFQVRLNQRVKEEIARTTTAITGVNTCNALAVKNLYAVAKRENLDFIKSQGTRLHSARSYQRIHNQAGFDSGKSAANSVSLRSSANTRLN